MTMRRMLVITIALVILPFSMAQNGSNESAKVRDALTAVSIGRHALVKVYGSSKIKQEEPLVASLQHGIWIVHGTLCCGKGSKHTCEAGTCVGGVGAVKIR